VIEPDAADDRSIPVNEPTEDVAEYDVRILAAEE